ncbi:hypothetical protein DENSPDRAFT_895533 [Dentipellis sp. KUC8613]|nr:hypothetical protein DENSPDRAFT_895533 [Dentipellis sp. KUC8613]
MNTTSIYDVLYPLPFFNALPSYDEDLARAPPSYSNPPSYTSSPKPPEPVLPREPRIRIWASGPNNSLMTIISVTAADIFGTDDDNTSSTTSDSDSSSPACSVYASSSPAPSVDTIDLSPGCAWDMGWTPQMLTIRRCPELFNTYVLEGLPDRRLEVSQMADLWLDNGEDGWVRNRVMVDAIVEEGENWAMLRMQRGLYACLLRVPRVWLDRGPYELWSTCSAAGAGRQHRLRSLSHEELAAHERCEQGRIRRFLRRYFGWH